MRHWLGLPLVTAAAALPAAASAALPGGAAGLPAGAAGLPAVAARVARDVPTVRPVLLPRDHAAHPGFAVEWWYTAGTFTASNGHAYFFFATVWSGMPGLVARLNVVDLQADRVVLADEYLTPARSVSGQARLRVGAFRLDWLRAGALGRWSVDAPTAGGRLRLTLVPRNPYVLNGRDGIIQQGPGGPSAYYSSPRLGVSGVLVLGSRSTAVSGQGWLDHQWGNFTGNIGSLRWNWFGCQLRDGRDLMLYQFLDSHDRPTSYRAGTLVTRHGGVDHLSRFTVLGLGPFIRPLGALATYPLGWRIQVRSARIDIIVRSLARNQFIKNLYVPSFWEGAASITRGAGGTCIVESSRELASFG